MVLATMNCYESRHQSAEEIDKILRHSLNSHRFTAIQIGRIQSIERSKDGRQQK